MIPSSLPGSVPASGGQSDHETERRTNSDGEEEEETPKVVQRSKQEAVPRARSPHEKDMWNQSLYLPSEFTNPPEKRGHSISMDDVEDDFPIALQPEIVEATEKPSNIPMKEGVAPRLADSGANMPKTNDVFRTEVESTQRFTCRRDFYRYMKSRITNLVLFRIWCVLIGAMFCVLAALISKGDINENPHQTGGVDLWRWLAFGAICFWAIPVSDLIVRLIELMLWYASPQWTTTVYYYLKTSRSHVAFLLITLEWLIGFYLLILSVAPNQDVNSSYFYGTQTFWSLFAASLAFLAARLLKELSASYFERTTFWSLVSDNLKREYFIFACCPGTPVPSPVVLTYHRAGEEATRSDPRVLRQCTKYLRRQCITAYDNVHPGSLTNPLANISGIIELTESEQIQDLSEIIFDHVWALLYSHGQLENEEDTTRSRLKAMRAAKGEDPEPAVRTMFTVGQNILHRAAPASSAGSIFRPTTLNGAASLGGPFDQQKLKREAMSHPGHVSGKKIHQKDFEGKMFVNSNQRGIDTMQVWKTLFDPNGRGNCTRKYLRNTMLRFYNDRLGLGHTLKDSQTAVDRLGTVYYGTAMIGVVVAVALLFAGPSSYNVWIGITSLFVTLAVVFGTSLSTMCQNIVFIFFRHPFDVGDLILYEGNYYSVRKLELLSTTLIKWNGQYQQVDNVTLSTSEFLNLTRSGLYWEFLEAYVDIATATETFLGKSLLTVFNGFLTVVLANVRQHFGAFLEVNSDAYSGKYQIIARALDRPLQIRINAYIEFAYRPTNLTRLFEDIGKINECFASALRKYSATEAGVGIGAVRASGEGQVQHLVVATGLFGRTKAISDAVGL